MYAYMYARGSFSISRLCYEVSSGGNVWYFAFLQPRHTCIFFSLPVCDCIDKVRYIRFLCGLLPPLVSLALPWTPHCLRLLPFQVEGSSTWWFDRFHAAPVTSVFFSTCVTVDGVRYIRFLCALLPFLYLSSCYTLHVTLCKWKEHIPRDTCFLFVCFFLLGCDYVLVVWCKVSVCSVSYSFISRLAVSSVLLSSFSWREFIMTILHISALCIFVQYNHRSSPL